MNGQRIGYAHDVETHVVQDGRELVQVDSELQIADFSARSSTVEGGKVDLAAPGVAVYSSWTMPTRYRSISGTSMATPHVAGVAALLSQASGVRGAELWAKLTQTARPLSLESADVGAGLVQAPA